MLFLNKADIARSIDLNELMDKIEYAYTVYASGQFYMPPRPSIEHKNKTLLYMPCFMNDIFGTKILTVFPDNASINLPAIDGLMLLNDYETGKPAAILDGQTVTAYRTGAVGGVGIRHLSHSDCRTVGIIGAGVQGFYQALYACAARHIHTVYLFSHSGRDLDDYIKRLKSMLPEQTEVICCQTVEELAQKSDIIITATPSESPVLPNDKNLLQGKCIIAIGSYKPTMREIPDCIWELVDCVYTELEFACEESGDLSQPLSDGLLSMKRVKYMDQFLADPQKSQIPAGKTTYFKSVGMGLFDLCVAQLIMEKANAKQIGQKIEL